MSTSARTSAAWLGASVAVAIAALVGFIYLGTLSAPFAFDDRANITGNPFIRVLAYDDTFFDRVTLLKPNPRPIANLSFLINYWLAGGYEVEAFRAVNLVIHGLNGVWVYLLGVVLLRRIAGQAAGPARAGAAAAALVFVAHPLQTQSVIYVVQRMNSLAGFFYFAGLWCYIAGREREGARRGAWWLGCGVAGLLALGSKEHAISLPVSLWLYEWLACRRGSAEFVRRSAPWAAGLALVAFAGAYFFWDPFAEYAEKPFSMGERVLTQLRVLWLYVGLLAWPTPGRLSLMHSVETSHGLFSPWTTALAAIAWAGVLVAAWRARVAYALPVFALLWFLVTIGVESSVLPLEMVYEHRTYLPLAGVCWALGYAVAVLSRRQRAATAVAIAVLVALLAVAAQQRGEVWLDREGLWRDALDKSDHERAHSNLGAALLEDAKFEDAVRHLEKARARFPQNADIGRLLGSGYAELARSEDAIDAYRRAVAIDPRDHVALAGIGTIYATLERYDEAIEWLMRSLEVLADERFLVNLAMVLQAQGEIDEALSRYAEAAWIAPGYAPAHLALGLLLFEQGYHADAIPPLRRALELEPRVEVALRLAVAQHETGDRVGALATAENAVARWPNSASAAHTLARLLLESGAGQGELSRAREMAVTATSLAGGAGLARALETLAQIEEQLGHGEAARAARSRRDEALSAPASAAEPAIGALPPE